MIISAAAVAFALLLGTFIFLVLPRGRPWQRATSATLFLVLLGTGASLYAGPISTIVAHRHAVKTIHVYAGLLLPLPLVLGILLPYGRRVRAG